MWRKEDGKPQAASETSAVNPAIPAWVGPISGRETPAGIGGSSKAAACVSQGIKIKGEVTGTEDLFVDGKLDGKLTLTNSILTIGPNAVVKAEVMGREVVVRGRVEGKVSATDRLQIWHSARINGDMKAERISIEEGAELHGKLEAGRVSAGLTEKTMDPIAKTEKAKKQEGQKAADGKSEDLKPASGAVIAGAD